MKTPPLIPVPLLIVTFIVIGIAIAVSLLGCASMDYEWTQVRKPSVKPWLYIMVQDIDRTCRDVGAHSVYISRFTGCATWKPVNCIIYLPPNAPSDIVKHEEHHCEGWNHQ